MFKVLCPFNSIFTGYLKVFTNNSARIRKANYALNAKLRLYIVRKILSLIFYQHVHALKTEIDG